MSELLTHVSLAASANFKLYYVSVRYGPERTPLSLTASRFPIPIEGSGTHFAARAVVYQDVSDNAAQIGVRCGVQPHLRRSDGTLVPMRKVNKPGSDEAYWVEVGDWVKNYLNFESESRNTVGSLTVVCGNQECVVEVTAGSRPISDAAFLSMLDDFQQALYRLVIDPTGCVNRAAWKTVPIFGDEVQRLLREFIKHAISLMDAPTHELRETQELRNISRVRPVRRTFMEIASKGTTNRLTSRAHQATYNTPENRYVAALVNRVHRIVSSTQKMLQKQERTQKQHRQKNLNRIEDISRLEADGWRDVIDMAQMEYELSEAREEVAAWEKRVQALQAAVPPGASVATPTALRVKITTKAYANPRPLGGGWHGAKCRLQSAGTYKVEDFKISLPNKLWFDGLFDDTGEYDLCIAYKHHQEPNIYRPGEERTVLAVSTLNSVAMVNTPLSRRVKKLAAQWKKLDTSDWKQSMDNRAIGELQQERSLLRERTKVVDDSALSSHIQSLSTMERQLLSLKKRQKALGIKPEFYFPGSIIFVQNRLYSGVKSTYERLLINGKINEDLWEEIIGLDDLAIIDLPTLYEKWCLVKFIECATEGCGFRPDRKDWIEEIVLTASGKRGQFTCGFDHAQLPFRIGFSYQPSWPNRAFGEVKSKDFFPDFVLSFFHQDGDGWKEYATLVCDAKCKDFAKDDPGHLARDAWVIDRKYRREPPHNDFIFVVHPAQGAIRRPRTSPRQSWGKSSFYGGSWPPDWKFLTEETNAEKTRWAGRRTPNHRLGALLMKPLSDESATDTDNLRRLVLMVLEYGSQSQEQLFCSACGSTDIDTEIREARLKPTFVHTCRRCNERAYYNHCNNKECDQASHARKRANLYKHGAYWTFHDYDPVDPYNIRCPQCGSTLDKE